MQDQTDYSELYQEIAEKFMAVRMRGLKSQQALNSKMKAIGMVEM